MRGLKGRRSPQIGVIFHEGGERFTAIRPRNIGKKRRGLKIAWNSMKKKTFPIRSRKRKGRSHRRSSDIGWERKLQSPPKQEFMS